MREGGSGESVKFLKKKCIYLNLVSVKIEGRGWSKCVFRIDREEI